MAEEIDVVDDPVSQWVTFRLQHENYGINVMNVQEVLRATEIAPVPGAPYYVLGIINLRGNVVPVIDTRTRFGLPQKDMDDNTRIIIMETGGQTVGTVVDSVAEVVDVRKSEMDSASPTNDESSRYISGVISKNSKLLILIDVDKFFDEDDNADFALS